MRSSRVVRPLPPPQLLPWSMLLTALAVLTILQVLFVTGVLPFDALRPVSRATHGLVRATLVANLAIFVVVIGVVLVGCGRQRARDLALPGRVVDAVVLTASVWLVVNALEAIDGWLAGDLAFDGRWRSQPGALMGQWIAVTFGTALLEEVLFRGVLLRQLRVRLARLSPVPALVAAIVVSQVLFALSHLPALIVARADVWFALPDLFVAGCALAMLFFATGNLALCIGVHGLADAPTLLMVDRWDLLDHQTFVVATCALLTAATLARGRLARHRRG